MNRIFPIDSLNIQVPDCIYLDTSFIVELYLNDPDKTKHAQECYEFTNRLVCNNTIMITTSIVSQELEHVILRGIYDKYAQKTGETWDKLKKDTNKYIPEVASETERVFSLIEQNPNIIHMPIDFNSGFDLLRRKVTAEYGLMSSDAAHVVAAFGLEVNSIATLDYDYSAVPGLNIYTMNERMIGINRRADNSLLPYRGLFSGEHKDEAAAAHTKASGS